MNPIKKIYKNLTALHWEIGFLDNTYEEIINGDNLKFRLVTHDYPDSWFADPFILDVTEKDIIVLVEEVIVPNPKGHITKLVIDRQTFHVKSKKILLERPGHLSFPVIYRHGNKVYVYPENSEDETLYLYEYDSSQEKLIPLKELSDKPLTDAIFTEYFGAKLLFTTEKDNPNGYYLNQYQWDEKRRIFSFVTSIQFKEHTARMAGSFFRIGEKVYRPAQESNSNYGHGISIQEVSNKDGEWSFVEVRRLESPYKKMTKGFHTLNFSNGVMVVDVKGYRNPVIGPLLVHIIRIFKRIIKL